MSKKPSIDYGQAAEQFCAAELVLRGFQVVWTVSDKVPYDFISDKNGKLKKIQVKGIFNQKDGRTYRTSLTGVKNRKYLSTEVDYFMVYIHDTKQYYIIPFGVMTEFNANGKAQRFLEAWELLE